MTDQTSATVFHWDSARFEKLQTWCARSQQGLIGLAIMLLMMDIASLFTLGPLFILFFVSYQAQRKLDEMLDQYENASIEVAPRSILLSQPSGKQETRYHLKELSDIRTEKKKLIESLVFTHQQEQVRLPGFKQAAELAQLLKDKRAELFPGE